MKKGAEKMEENKTNYKKAAAQIAIILFGLTCYACGVVFFILPLDMIAAGTTGIALVAEHLWVSPFPALWPCSMC